MSISEKTLDELRQSFDPPSSSIGKIGWLVLGLTTGYLLSYFLPQLVLRIFRVSATALGTALTTTVVVFLCLLCILVAWVLRHRRYFAIGLIIPAFIKVLVLVAAVGLWLVARPH